MRREWHVALSAQAGRMRNSSEPPPEADAQGGVFTELQAVEAGISRYRIRNLRRRGAWVTVIGTVLADTSVVQTPALVARAAQLAVGRGVVISHLTAALLHGLKVPSDGFVHLIIGRDQRLRWDNVRPHRVAVDDTELELVDGILRTTLSRTILDCLLWLPEDAGRTMLVDAFRRRLITVDEVGDVVRSSVLRHGIGRAWSVLREVASDAHSEGEVLLHRLMRNAGIRGWRANQAVHDDAGLIGYVDVLFDEEPVVVELDGQAYHSGPDEFQRDRERQNRLVAAGYRVLRFTWHDVTREPERLVAEIRGLLDQRAA